MMDVEIDCDAFRISYELAPGGAVVVVAFTGVGQGFGLGGASSVQTEEFRKSLVQDGESGGNSVIYVIEKRRRWYNDGVITAMTACINGIIGKQRPAYCVTLGNSMGGFGAIVFAKRLARCRQVIAFCPQSSVSPDVAPFETRWPEWRSHIRAWDVPDATTELAADIRYDVFFGQDDARDVRHAERFRRAGFGNMHVHLLPECGHDVARRLKQQGKLTATIQALIRAPNAAPQSSS